MHKQISSEIAEQVSRACVIIDRHLGHVLQAIHLYGSALDGGLKPYSDIDLLVTVNRRLDETSRHTLIHTLQQDLLAISAPPGESDTLRALEVTVVTCNELVPWRYPPRRELQFGEWLRDDLRAGIYEPPMPDHDLAILITKIRQRSIAVIGPPAVDLFDAVPKADFYAALADTIAQWQDEPDWQGDERNVVLALARIWYSASTGEIASKQRAAEWGLEQLPARHRDVLDLARSAYLGADDRALVARKAETKAFIDYVKMEIKRLLPRK
ncbi:3''-adenylyltransferase [Alcanivorax sp. S71-1-4]|uniref:AadA family aminoglycoside 3''-O-nucleotidyltransferase n=1 Tax=Alcanivorax sp. S71-1-4 TaxID=1177159 RepID=UPI00135C6FE3|nr:AadA family aminoglycoside 3''-O-nucleotidyltransferase [Alcanivorax sp. S71-1-4]KAF0811179.1 3''-adenylyltransferase [Alcanivorax sp. S71-1-4]